MARRIRLAIVLTRGLKGANYTVWREKSVTHVTLFINKYQFLLVEIGDRQNLEELKTDGVIIINRKMMGYLQVRL